MYVSKTPSPRNFRYDQHSELKQSWYRAGASLLALEVSDERWQSEPAIIDFSPSALPEFQTLDLTETNAPSGAAGGDAHPELELVQHSGEDPDQASAVPCSGGFSLLWRGAAILDAGPIGVGGEDLRSWIVNFRSHPEYRFYGLGEKNGGPEFSGRRVGFRNTDVLGDFPWQQVISGEPDPMYISIPYVLIHSPGGWLGVFSHNLYRSWMALGSNPHIEIMDSADTDQQLFIAAEDGAPVLFFIAGDTPEQVTRQFHRLLGTHPRPPLWSLGHHQSRWGYAGPDDLNQVREQFRKYGIPNDGLWLDIDYMDGYRVFSFDPDLFPDPGAEIDRLQSHGHRVVPIIDPGVKLDPGYPPYQEGSTQELFCKNSAGGEYVGYVWPGETVFPDFSLAETRDWWAKKVSVLADLGIEGIWLDMNDPATGDASPEDMRFQNGRLPHGYFHNSYALGMQKASREGFQRHAPDLRPFILSRSGSPGTSRYAAVWLGDNASNYHHLAQTIKTGMNLGLSGIPFWGADVPGFIEDADAKLMIDWYKSAFLQPFLRNHSCKGTAHQEPWKFGSRVRNIVSRFIRLRYRLLPYLYNLHIEQELHGGAILAPLWYHFPDSMEESWNIGDAFMVGPSILQAPSTMENQQKRKVYLPAQVEGEHTFPGWFDAGDGSWKKGGRWIQCSLDDESTPLFFREDSIIPMLHKEPKTNQSDISNVEFHVIMRAGSRATLEYRYVSDDGLTGGYTRANQTEISIKAHVRRQGGGKGKKETTLQLYLEHLLQGFGPVRISFFLYDEFDGVELHSSSGKLHGKRLEVKDTTRRFSGNVLKLFKTKSITFKLQ
ncbi:glycoside hydrolase family 31 protein [Salinispira pacifica]|uniref:Alpha-glucosidase n=1 Tax=Salinispira pacifica TaxID=1307761 RepID=V5WKL2_9SPIO|nr:glycoside hydrolase family 31 protein [Salinispira pacifica]AHC16079.1 Alpha-glucosidase [Salinispira pacifica]